MEQQQYKLVEENTNLKQQFEDLKEEMDGLKHRVQVDVDASQKHIDENTLMINENLEKIGSMEQKIDEMHKNLENSKQRGNISNLLNQTMKCLKYLSNSCFISSNHFHSSKFICTRERYHRTNMEA